MHWLRDFNRIAGEQPCVLVTLIIISGSAPRESGCRMIVTRDDFAGSIGGGNLEFQATVTARELLEIGAGGSQRKKLVGLGPELNQCCGGAVALYYEVYRDDLPAWAVEAGVALDAGKRAILATALDRDTSEKAVIGEPVTENADVPRDVLDAARSLLRPGDHPEQPNGIEVRTETGGWWLEHIRHTRRPVMLFGAGHVGQAVAHALTPLPFGLTWVDSREGVFPDDRPGAIQTVTTDDPAGLVAGAGAGTIFVVMTHSHELDEAICFEVLRRDDFAWLGLIGSDTKRRRFAHRLEKRGIQPARLEALNCPIGLAGIRGKQPATIALSLAAQLMTNYEE